MARTIIVRVLRLPGAPTPRRPGTTTCGRCGPSSGLAPLGAGAETLEEHSHDARDQRETVETCLHHGSLDLRVLAPPFESLSTPVVGGAWTRVEQFDVCWSGGLDGRADQ